MQRLLLTLSLLLAGCAGLGTPDTYQPDPAQTDCDYPNAEGGSRFLVVGIVADADGAGLSNATLRATITGTDQATTTTSNAHGCYFLRLEPEHTYSIRASMDGFQTTERPNVDAIGGEKQIINYRLQLV